MKVTREKYEALLKELEEMKAKIEQCEITNDEFEVKGKWCVVGDGSVWANNGESDLIKARYNYWGDKETAKIASKMQRRHNAIMNYVSQKQPLGEGDYSVYKNGLHNWIIGTNFNTYYPDAVLMFKSTAEQMIKDIKSGFFKLDEL